MTAMVAHSINEPAQRGQAEGDARLIAAAPELLVALQGLCALYEADEGCRELPEYLAARSAIAKAVG